MKRHWRIAIALCLGAMLTHCRGTNSPASAGDQQSDRKVAMQSMAWRVSTLRKMLGPEAPEPQAEEVVRALSEIRNQAAGLQEHAERSAHPLLDERIDDFVSEIDAAIARASQDEPNFLAAENIVGSCAGCHDVGACPFGEQAQCLHTAD